MNRTASTSRAPFAAALGLLLALAIALGAPLTAMAAEAETNECLNLASCTSVPNTPWVAVPGAKTGFTESNQGIEQPGTTLWRVDCPASMVPAGRDYSGRETTNELERTQHRGRIVVHARTSAFETDRVELQIHAICRR